LRFLDICKTNINIRIVVQEAWIVPRFKPPFSIDLVKKSPKVAPNGRVRMNAIQKR